MALIRESRLDRSFSKCTVADRKKLPPSQYALLPNVFPKRTVEVLRKGATKINRVNPHFCGNTLQCPFPLKRVVQAQGLRYIVFVC